MKAVDRSLRAAEVMQKGLDNIAADINESSVFKGRDVAQQLVNLHAEVHVAGCECIFANIDPSVFDFEFSWEADQTPSDAKEEDSPAFAMVNQCLDEIGGRKNKKKLGRVSFQRKKY